MKNLISAILILTSAISFSQQNFFFKSQIHKSDYPIDLVNWNGYYYYTVGIESESYITGSILYKLNQSGNVVDSMLFQKNSGTFILDDLFFENDTLYSFGVYSSDSVFNQEDLILLKIDSNLDIISEFHYSTPFSTIGFIHHIVNYRQNFIVYALGITPDNYINSFIYEIDSSSNLIHSYLQNTTNADYIFSCVNVGSNLLVFLLSNHYISLTNHGGSFITLDSNYNFLRADSIPFLDNMETATYYDKKIYVSGKNSTGGEFQYEIIKMDTTNQVFHHLVFGTDTTADFPASSSSHTFTSDGNIILVGTIQVDINNMFYSMLPSWVEVTKIDTAFNILWTRRFGGDGHYNAVNVSAIENGGVIVSAMRYDFDTIQQTDNVLWKLNKDGFASAIKGNLPPELNVSVYPNPTSSNIYFSLPAVPENTAVISIYNIQGKAVKTVNLNNRITKVSVQNLPQGLYFYRITENNRLTGSGKFVKQ